MAQERMTDPLEEWREMQSKIIGLAKADYPLLHEQVQALLEVLSDQQAELIVRSKEFTSEHFTVASHRGSLRHALLQLAREAQSGRI